MAEIGPLLLPPPAAISSRSVAPVRTTASRQGNGEGTASLATIDPTANATEGNSRAKQFRFRVVDGGRSDTLGNAELPATSRQAGAADEARTATQEREGSSGHSSKQIPLGTFSAPFLAQLIAQEQLQPGLHDPPVKQADRAYRQAGAEPPLSDADSSVAHFRIAV
ncbi:MAG: hypothetical protein HYU58_16645 [Proteobacteria bacterium]|nr:hypothetical protein [Pseudomonadota bacterium]